MPFEPVQVANCRAWWDTTDPTADGSTQFDDDQAIGALGFDWYDKVGNLAITQSTSGSRPAYKLDILNGNPIIRLDGVDDFLQFPSEIYDIADGDSTVFIVAKTSNTTSIQTLFALSTSGEFNYGMRYGIEGSGIGLALALTYPETIATTMLANSSASIHNSVFLRDITIDDYNVFVLSRESALQTFAINNTFIDSNNSGANVATIDNGTLGALDGSSEFAAIDVAEIIFYDRKLSNEEVKKIKEYLGEKWGVYIPNSFKQTTMALASDRLVKLYEIDATNLGGQIYRFVSSVDTTMQIASLTSVANTATCRTVNNHALEDNDPVRMSSIDQTNYNGDFFITVIDPKTFSFSMSGGAVSPATGANMLATRLNNTVRYNGYDYIPVAFEADGFEWNGQAQLPTPKIKISNVNKILLASVISLNDLMGAKFTRIRTFRKFLDDGSDPDTTAIYPKEIYKINKKTAHNKIYLEFELASSIDQEGVLLPNRQCLKNLCTHRYRRFDTETGVFDYTKATCPYVGSTYFKKTNINTSSASEDVCGKNLDSCRLRFGTNPLPTRAFPGIGG